MTVIPTTRAPSSDAAPSQPADSADAGSLAPEITPEDTGLKAEPTPADPPAKVEPEEWEKRPADALLRMHYQERPAEIPPKFWRAGENGELGFVDVAGLAQSYAHLERHAGELSEKTAVPERYTVPERVAGLLGEQAASDPALQEAFKVARASGVPQAALDGVVNSLVDQVFGEPAQQRKEADFAARYCNGDVTAARERRDAIHSRLNSALAHDPDSLRVATLLAGEPDGLRLLERVFLGDPLVRRHMSDGNPMPTPGINPAVGGVNEAQVKEWMRSEAYQNASHPKHKEMRRKVAQGWDAIYGDKQISTAQMTMGGQRPGEIF